MVCYPARRNFQCRLRKAWPLQRTGSGSSHLQTSSEVHCPRSQSQTRRSTGRIQLQTEWHGAREADQKPGGLQRGRARARQLPMVQMSHVHWLISRTGLLSAKAASSCRARHAAGWMTMGCYRSLLSLFAVTAASSRAASRRNVAVATAQRSSST
jgi:hypothetical protein